MTDSDKLETLDVDPETVYGLKLAIAFDNLWNLLIKIPREYWKTKMIENIGANTSIADIIGYLIYRSKTIISVEFSFNPLPLVEIYEKYSYGGIDYQCSKFKSNAIKLIGIVEQQQKFFGLFRPGNVMIPKIESLIKDYEKARRYICKCSTDNGWLTATSN